MFGISIDPSVEPKYSIKRNKLELFYPCSTHDSCFPYSLRLKRGFYLFECYGASGGTEKSVTTTQRETTGTNCVSQDIVKKYKGNTKCDPMNSPGSGAYISAKLYIDEETIFYANIGGSGVYGRYPDTKGGYNGGGECRYVNCASGGGATDLRVIENELTHRILVAGAGGGTDNTAYLNGENIPIDDGSGGSGGYPEGQGYWNKGVYQNIIANQASGYKFGIGESASESVPSNYDIAGAGAGWFGGYVSGSNNGGAGGGSSFVLSINATIPSDVGYAFDPNSKYRMHLTSFANGIWSGDGKMIITKLDSLMFTCHVKKTLSHTPLFVYILLR